MKKVLLTLLTSFSLSLLIAQPAGWNYVAPVQVQNNTTTLATNYQVQLTINTQTLIGAGQMLATGDDLRFGKDCAGTTLFNYWIESGINTASTVIWVKIDTLPASGTTQFFMYYGNASATAVSAIMGTFVGPHSSTDSTANTSLSGSANAQRGFRFAPTEDILVTAFGKNTPQGNPRYVTLFNYTTQAILSQQQVAGPATQWSYANIANPLWLTQNTQYLLEVFFPSGDDAYYFGASPTMGQHIQYFDMRYCNGCTQNTFPTNSLGGMLYGYVDMWYFTKTTLAVAPTITFSAAGPITVTTSNATICLNDSVAVTANVSGGISPYAYSWSPVTGVGNPNSITTMFSPASTTTYTLTVTDGCGNASTGSATVTVNALPVVTAQVSTDSVCTGSSFIPMGGGASTYAWSGGLTDNTAFTPSVTDTYTVTGTDVNGCMNSASVGVTVLNLPSVSATATSTSVCDGNPVTLSGAGAQTYSWDNSVTDGAAFIPAATTMYHVTGIDAYGCQNSDSIMVTVIALPVIATTSTGAFCAGAGADTLGASGADSFVWMPGPLTGNSIIVSPSATTSYTVIGMDTTTGCSDSTTVTVVVNPNPVLAVTDDTVCVGNCAQLNATATNGTPSYSYNWVPAIGLSADNIPNPVACNTTSMCYTVVVTDANGCNDSEVACAFVNQLPVVTATGPSTTCVTDGAYTLTGTPATGTFSGPGVTGSTFNPATAGNGTHQVVYTYTDGNGCSAMDTLTIVVSPCVGIADNNAADGIDVFPNPFSDVLVVNLASATNTVRMVNSLGQVVFEQEMNAGRNEINTVAFDSGVYFLEVVSAEGKAIVKIVKQ